LPDFLYESNYREGSDTNYWQYLWKTLPSNYQSNYIFRYSDNWEEYMSNYPSWYRSSYRDDKAHYWNYLYGSFPNVRYESNYKNMDTELWSYYRNEMPNYDYMSNYIEQRPANYWSYVWENFPKFYMSNYREQERSDLLFSLCMDMRKVDRYDGFQSLLKTYEREPEAHPLKKSPKYFWPIIIVFAIIIPSMMALTLMIALCCYVAKRRSNTVVNLQRGYRQ
jgi:hypothetical protein